VRRLALLIPCVAALGCSQPYLAAEKPVLEDRGEVVVYLQPLPQGADRIGFHVESVSALPAQGPGAPLSVSLREVGGSDEAALQERIASGEVPPGAYRGISIKIGKSFLRGEQGEGALLALEEPVTVEHEFRVERRKAVALFLSFDPTRSVTDGFRFAPAFSLSSPRRMVINLAGYATDRSSNRITVFDKSNLQVVDVIATGGGPAGIVLDQRQRQAYVALSGGDSVEVIDLVSGEITARVSLNFGDRPETLALAPDGRTLLSVNRGSETVSVIDTGSRIETARVKVGEGPTDVAIDRNGLRAYVVNSLSDTVSVVDLARNQILGTVDVEKNPLAAALSRNGDRLYVVCRFSPDLLAIDPSSLTVRERIFVGTGAVSIKVDTQTDLVYVGNDLTGEIAVVDPFSSMSVDTIRAGGNPFFLTIDGEERALFVSNPVEQKIQKINIVNRKIVAELKSVEGTREIAVMGEI
jgi:YVTN family beta-propeller protein